MFAIINNYLDQKNYCYYYYYYYYYYYFLNYSVGFPYYLNIA